jgi:hypothetical protein
MDHALYAKEADHGYSFMVVARDEPKYAQYKFYVVCAQADYLGHWPNTEIVKYKGIVMAGCQKRIELLGEDCYERDIS